MKKFMALFLSLVFASGLIYSHVSALETPKIVSVFEQDESVSVIPTDTGIVCTSPYKFGAFMYNSSPFDLTNGFSTVIKINDNPPYFIQQQDGTITSDIKYLISFGAKNQWWGDNDSFAIVIRPLDSNTTLVEAQFVDSEGFTWVARQGFSINPTSDLRIEVKKDADSKWFIYLNDQKANEINIENFSTRFLSKCTNNQGYFGYGHAYEQGGTTPIGATIKSINNEKFYTESINASSIALSVKTLTLKPGDVKKITATVLPENTNDKSVTWSSSDDSIATVSNDGTVHAIKVGNVEITAKTTNNISEKCSISIIRSDLASDNFINKLDPNQNPAPIITDIENGVKISSTQIATGFLYNGKNFDLSNGFSVNLQLLDVPAYFIQNDDGVITSDIWYAISFGSQNAWWTAGNNLFAVLIRPLGPNKISIEAQYQDSDGFTWISRQEFPINPKDKLKIEMKKTDNQWYLFLNNNKADEIDVSKFNSRFLSKCTNNNAIFGYGYFYAQNNGKVVSAVISNVNDAVFSSYDPNTSSVNNDIPATGDKTNFNSQAFLITLCLIITVAYANKKMKRNCNE